MKKFSFLAAIVLLLMGACTHTDDTGQAPESLAGKAGKERLYTIKRVGVATKAVAEKGKTWEPGSTITIKFLNGDAALQAKVQQYAAEWLQYANLKFKYVGAAEQADVKVGFEYGDEFPYISWSTIGTDCQLVPQDEASLNFVGIEGEEEEFIKAEVLRGFGHVLGLGFEHRSPNSPVEFKYTTTTEKNKIKGYFGLTLDEIMESIVPLYTQSQSNYTEYDDASIMRLGLPGSILKNPALGVLTNSELSEMDKKFIAELYPKYVLKEIGKDIAPGSWGFFFDDKLYISDYYSGIRHTDRDHNLYEDDYLLCGRNRYGKSWKFGNTAYFERVETSRGEPNTIEATDVVILYLDNNDGKLKYTNLEGGYFISAFEANDGKIYVSLISEIGLLYSEPNNRGVFLSKELPLPLYNGKQPTKSGVTSFAKDENGRVYMSVYYKYEFGNGGSMLCYFDADGSVKVLKHLTTCDRESDLHFISNRSGRIYLVNNSVQSVSLLHGDQLEELYRSPATGHPFHCTQGISDDELYLSDGPSLFRVTGNSVSGILTLGKSIKGLFVTSKGVFLSDWITSYQSNLYFVEKGTSTPILIAETANVYDVYDVVEGADGTIYFLTYKKLMYLKL